jgi:hypothetical protein
VDRSARLARLDRANPLRSPSTPRNACYAVCVVTTRNFSSGQCKGRLQSLFAGQARRRRRLLPRPHCSEFKQSRHPLAGSHPQSGFETAWSWVAPRNRG